MQLLRTGAIGLRRTDPVSSKNITTYIRTADAKMEEKDGQNSKRAVHSWGVSLVRQLVGINDDRCMGGVLIWWGSNPPLGQFA